MIEWFDILLALGGLVAGVMVGLTGMGGAVHGAARAMDDMVTGLRHELAQLAR